MQNPHRTPFTSTGWVVSLAVGAFHSYRLGAAHINLETEQRLPYNHSTKLYRAQLTKNNVVIDR